MKFFLVLLGGILVLAACQQPVPEALGVEILEPVTGVAVEETVPIRFLTTGPVTTVRVSVQGFETEVPASTLETRSLEFFFLLDTLNLENGPAVIEVAVADSLGNEASDRTAVNVRNFFVRTLSPEDLATVSGIMTVDVKTNRLVGFVDIVVYDGFFAKFFEQLVPVDGHVIVKVDTTAFTDSKFSYDGVAFVDAYGYFENGDPIFEETGFDYTDVFFVNGNGLPVDIITPTDGAVIEGDSFEAIATVDPNRVVGGTFFIYDPTSFNSIEVVGTLNGDQLTATIDVSGFGDGFTFLDVSVQNADGDFIGWDYVGLNLGTEVSPLRGRLAHPAFPQLYERGTPPN